MYRWSNLTALPNPKAGSEMLVVGDQTRRGLADQLDAPGIHFISFAELDQARFAQIRPDIVVAALMSPVIDALDLAERLDRLGFCGRFWALASTVPRIPMVRQEIRAIAPNIDFEIVTLATLSDLIQERQALRQAAP